MSTWRPITESEFEELLSSQLAELLPEEREKLTAWRSPTRKVRIRRSRAAGDEYVYVIAEVEGSVLYFDDVEYGWNASPLTEDGYIATPGGSQATLHEFLCGAKR